MDIGYCFSCGAFDYAIPDHNAGVHSNTSGGHFGSGHQLVTLDETDPKLPPPVRIVVMKMRKELAISDNELTLAALAVDLGELDYLRK